MPHYREDFDRLECACPACRATQRSGEMYLHPRCHPASPTWVRCRGDVLTVECAECRREVVTLVIASRAHDGPGLGPEPEAEPEDDERCP